MLPAVGLPESARVRVRGRHRCDGAAKREDGTRRPPTARVWHRGRQFGVGAHRLGLTFAAPRPSAVHFHRLSFAAPTRDSFQVKRLRDLKRVVFGHDTAYRPRGPPCGSEGGCLSGAAHSRSKRANRQAGDRSTYRALPAGDVYVVSCLRGQTGNGRFPETFKTEFASCNDIGAFRRRHST